MTEERLDGGNVGGAWRVGDTVRRTTGPSTPAVHALLRHLRARDTRCVPSVHGFDERGREILDYLPGTVVDVEHLTDGQLRSLVTWTRELHERVAGFRHGGPWRLDPHPGATMVGHNDLAAYNVCFDGDNLVGVFDWDLAGPTTPLFELAFIAWNGVPLWRDTGPAHTAARLELIAAAYGGPSARAIFAALPQRIGLLLDGMQDAAAAGDPGMTAWLATGIEPELSQRTLTEIAGRAAGINSLLRP